MAKQNGRDWDALRDEWVNRRLRGESLTRQDFAREKDIPYSTLRKKSPFWQDELDQREAEIQALVKDRTTIDHATMRVAILEEREPLRELFLKHAERWLKAADEDEDERIELRELNQLGNLLVKMAEVGAGLPKEHVVRHDEAHDTVAVGRREMKSLEGAVVGLAEWRRKKRLQAKKAKA